MNASLRALMSGVIDYAGLFPPAKLPLEQAIRNYARYRQEADAWMLGRFVIPAGRLPELDAFADLFQDGPPFAFSVLGPSEAPWWEWRDELDEALNQIKVFRQRHSGRVLVEVLEAKAPTDVIQATDPQIAAGRLEEICTVIEQAECADVAVFFEVGCQESTISAALEAMGLYDRHARLRADFKLRCGGVTASAFPTAEQIAHVIRQAAKNRVALKFTAGLHHPLRGFDAGLQTYMHGFINVLAAGALALARPSAAGTLIPVVADQDPAHFTFTDDGMMWKELFVGTGALAAVRRAFVRSFGSCSFDEPRNDLRALGWL